MCACVCACVCVLFRTVKRLAAAWPLARRFWDGSVWARHGDPNLRITRRAAVGVALWRLFCSGVEKLCTRVIALTASRNAIQEKVVGLRRALGRRRHRSCLDTRHENAHIAVEPASQPVIHPAIDPRGVTSTKAGANSSGYIVFVSVVVLEMLVGWEGRQ